ncbi:MAG: thiamine phosphate synthase [Luteibaculum sp.]
MPKFPPLQYITGPGSPEEIISRVEANLTAGIRWIQLRYKYKLDEAHLKNYVAIGQEVSKLCKEYDAVFIVNDKIEYVDIFNADGVHVGLEDAPLAVARRVIGSKKILGATANTWQQVASASKGGADYIGLGPYRFTQTKEKLAPVLGDVGYTDIMARVALKSINCPIYAIGGIGPGDVPALIKTGVSGIAASSALEEAATRKKMLEAIKHWN